jgi:UDP-N-acetylmuramate--alanine ligase
MIAQVLIEAGLDPTVIVGSLLKSGTNFISGKSKYLVVEACEYKRSFLNIKPDIAIITNIDDDHLDYYKDLTGIQKGFSEFIHGIKEGGILVTNLEDNNVKPILSNFDKKVLDYASVSENITLNVPGQHNIKNARAVLVVAEELGISKEVILSGLKNFTGTWRRFEKIGQTKSGAFVYDDYAHHPTEIKATLEAVREKFPNNQIIAVFQPHLYSRTKEHFYEFGNAFSSADQILILPIYAAREQKDPTISNYTLVQEIQKEGKRSVAFETFESAVDFLKTNLKKNDVVFTIGAGDVNKLAKMLVS